MTQACGAKDMVLSAGAGTGKTHALVSKYIGELTRRRDGGYARVDQLAAITFTEKAATEMRERVRDRLTVIIEALRSKDENTAVSSANLTEERSGLNERQRRLLSLVRQRQSLQGAYISTIHSFCARLLRENPIAAGVDPSFTVLDEIESAALLEDAAHRVILNKLRAGDKAVAALIRDFGFESRGERAPGLKSHLARLIPLVRTANTTPGRLMKRYEDFLASLPDQAEAAGAELFGALLPKMKKHRKNTKIYKLATRMEKEPELFSPPVEDLETAMELSQQAKRLDNGASSDPDRAELEQRAAQLLRDLAGPALEGAIAPNTRSFLALAKEVMREYRRARERRSALDYEDLQEKFRDLLRNNPGARDALRAKFTRVLVDEFQDINDLQQEIIGLLAPPGEGRLFIVGDVKQAIYGFRGADVEVFGQVAGEITGAGGARRALKNNRRSTPRLIKFTNAFFSKLMSGEENGSGVRFHPEADSLIARRRSLRFHRAPSRLMFSAPPGGGGDGAIRRIEARTLAAELKEKIESESLIIEENGSARPAGYADVAMLFRTFSGLDVYESAFRNARVPFQVVKGKGFYHSQEIRDFINLFRFLDYSEDTLALMSVLRSPLVGLGDHTLLRLRRKEDGSPAGNPARMIEDGRIPEGVEPEESEKIRLFAMRSRKWKEARHKGAVSELIETVLEETGYGALMMSRFQGEQKLANLYKLIELARQFEAGAGGGFKGFVSRLSMLEREAVSREAQADVTGGENAVKMMTVHQSKGLEFPVVILADLGAPKQSSTSRLAFHHTVGLGLQHYDAGSGLWREGPMFWRASEARKKAETDEARRLLYVAMTRAKDLLILSGSGARSKGVWERWVDESIENAGLEVERRVIKQSPATRDDEGAAASPPLADRLLRGPMPRPRRTRKETRDRPSHASQIRVSVTALAAFSLCPRLYYYQNVMCLPEAPADFGLVGAGATGRSGLSLGSRVHEALEKMELGEGACADAVEKAVRDNMADLGDKEREEARARLEKAFSEEPLAELWRVPAEAVLREARMALRIDGKDVAATLTGAADVAWFNGERWRVADYKYSSRPADELRYLTQVRLYAFALMESVDTEALDYYVVYLKESENPCSGGSVARGDLPGIRDSVLKAARDLAELEGAAERNWPRRGEEESPCSSFGCSYRDRCRPRGAAGSAKPTRPGS